MTETVYNLLDIIQEQNKQIELLKAVQGVVRYDAGFFYDDPNIFWDQN